LLLKREREIGEITKEHNDNRERERRREKWKIETIWVSKKLDDNQQQQQQRNHKCCRDAKIRQK